MEDLQEILDQWAIMSAIILGFIGGIIVPDIAIEGWVRYIVGFSFLIFTLSISILIVRSVILPIVANRLITANMHKRLVDGFWVQKSFESGSPEKLDSLAVLQMTYQGLHLVISGDVFDPDYQRIGNFRSEIVLQRKLKARFTYSGKNIRPKDMEVQGHGEYVFSEGKRNPSVYNGFVQDNLNYGNKVFVQGQQLKGLLNDYYLKDIDKESTMITVLKMYVNGTLGTKEKKFEY